MAEALTVPAYLVAEILETLVAAHLVGRVRGRAGLCARAALGKHHVS